MKTFHTPLRSSMSLFTNMVKDRRPWGLADVLREKARKEKRALAFEKLRSNAAPRNIRFAVTRKRGSGFHIIGVGKVKARNFNELKQIAKSHGYTHLRFGAIKTAL